MAKQTQAEKIRSNRAADRQVGRIVGAWRQVHAVAVVESAAADGRVDAARSVVGDALAKLAEAGRGHDARRAAVLALGLASGAQAARLADEDDGAAALGELEAWSTEPASIRRRRMAAEARAAEAVRVDLARAHLTIGTAAAADAEAARVRADGAIQAATIRAERSAAKAVETAAASAARTVETAANPKPRRARSKREPLGALTAHLDALDAADSILAN